MIYKLSVFITMVLLRCSGVLCSSVPTLMNTIMADQKTISDDLKEILRINAFSEDFITFRIENKTNEKNLVTVKCSKDQNHISLLINSKSEEWSFTLYYALQKLGFLFPHPRKYITPKKQQIFSYCGQTLKWNPAFRFRGLHLHTLHPNEWVHGFFVGEKKIAFDTIKWLARNGQNIMDLSLLQMEKVKIYQQLKSPFELARKMGIYSGLSLGMAFQQQNSFKLLGLMRATMGVGSSKVLKKELEKLILHLDFSFLSLEAGTSEFTPTNYKQTLKWIETASSLMAEHGRQLFIKIHVSSNQYSSTYGNYNFLPQYSDKRVGVLPHTVMFYHLNDEVAPMYGNQNFIHIKEFLLQELGKRPVWYYPETSYFIFMDIDVPLFLTDYLLSRSRDMNYLSGLGLEGQMNFTTGQELGYWLMDWTVALLNNKDYQFDPLIGLQLLGEDLDVWRKIFKFQTKYIKSKGMISMLSGANFQDEMIPAHQLHRRNLLKDLRKDQKLLTDEIDLLKQAVKELPFLEKEIEKIKDEELKRMVKVTFLRFRHAYELRKALLFNQNLEMAKTLRKEALGHMEIVVEKFNRYPEALTFEKQKNPTSYQFGYGYTAQNLYVWEREEMQISLNQWSPFFMNLYNIWDILF